MTILTRSTLTRPLPLELLLNLQPQLPQVIHQRPPHSPERLCTTQACVPPQEATSTTLEILDMEFQSRAHLLTRLQPDVGTAQEAKIRSKLQPQLGYQEDPASQGTTRTARVQQALPTPARPKAQLPLTYRKMIEAQQTKERGRGRTTTRRLDHEEDMVRHLYHSGRRHHE